MTTNDRHHRRHDTPLGEVLLVATAAGVCGLYFHDHVGIERVQLGRSARPGELDDVRRQLDEYFAGRLRAFDVRLAMEGPAFSQRVWAALRRIPPGTTTSYAAIAQEIGSPRGAARAVGASNGKNPVSIIVPCHRVIGSGGALTGYAGGLARKSALLQLEGAIGKAVVPSAALPWMTQTSLRSPSKSA
jgi:methylated-DNA-[protein]-cysteine S-methyltransferase